MIKFIFDYDKSKNLGIIQSDYLDNLREYFSIADPVANFKKIRYGRYMPSRIYAITQSGRFRVGMFGEIITYIRTLDIPYKIVVTKLIKEQYFADYQISKIENLKLQLREYQEQSIKKALKQGNGVIEIGTGGGKTLVMASLINTIRKNSEKNHKTLVVVPGIQLVEQTYHDFLSYGIKKNEISKWSGDNDYNNTPIIIASLSILLSKNTSKSLYENVDLLIFDEAHKIKSTNKTNKLVSAIKTNHRFSFTGTMPESNIDQWNIIGQFGPILFKKTSNDLQKDDFIVNAAVQVINIKYLIPLTYHKTSSVFDPTARYNEECEYVHSQPFRNSLIAKLSHNVDKNILILVDRIEHGEILKEEISNYKSGKQIYFIRGSVEVEDREKIRKIMEEEDNVICIAITSIFSTGINIKNLHYILFACAGKAKIKIIQSIGRGLRLHESKDTLIIFDISDHLVYSSKHLTKRLELYRREKIKYAIKQIKELKESNRFKGLEEDI